VVTLQCCNAGPLWDTLHAGDRLRVDYFHGTTIYREQVPIDMSEPAVYEIWQRQIPLIERYIAPKQYFLSMDEVRIGGFCEACKRRHLSMAQILGDSVTRQHDMISAVNPQAQVYVWSDMFDPNHNAVAEVLSYRRQLRRQLELHPQRP
jgi:hypothetical protein